MIPQIISFLPAVLNLFKNDAAKIASEVGIAPGQFNTIVEKLKDFASKDERIMKLQADMVEQARQHDKASYNDVFTDRIRGLVRPILTLVVNLVWASSFYIPDMQLRTEDYAIIGLVNAFWFGLRPFEKEAVGLFTRKQK